MTEKYISQEFREKETRAERTFSFFKMKSTKGTHLLLAEGANIESFVESRLGKLRMYIPGNIQYNTRVILYHTGNKIPHG